jgi:iron complex transport system permease protein
VQAATAVTVMSMNVDVINVAWPIIVLITVLMILRHRVYDVMSLGSEQSRSLGVAYDREVNITLVLISLGMAVSTAMIGSLTFLGLLVVNAGRELLKTNRHLPLFACAAGIGVLTLVLGSAIEQLILGLVPLTTIINLVGCAYVFYLLLKENRT